MNFFFQVGTLDRSQLKGKKFWQFSDYPPNFDWCKLTGANVSDGQDCDLSRTDLRKKAINFMRKNDPDPDFIIWTVDTAKDLTKNNLAEQLEDEREIVKYLKSKFPYTNILPVLGNSDSLNVELGNYR